MMTRLSFIMTVSVLLCCDLPQSCRSMVVAPFHAVVGRSNTAVGDSHTTTTTALSTTTTTTHRCHHDDDETRRILLLPPVINHKLESPLLIQQPRRSLFGILLGVTTIIATTTTVSPHRVQAATTNNNNDDPKVKLEQGLSQLNYLLEHWEEETTICGRSGDNPYISKNGCERTPVRVMDYLGYKDINHPLFRADKTMRRLEGRVPADREVDFVDAMEAWTVAAEEGNGMAYISSWGEANPGGGKDRVALFLERAKKNVVQARDSLATIVEILEIPPL